MAETEAQRPSGTCTRCGAAVEQYRSGWWAVEPITVNAVTDVRRFCADGIHHHEVEPEGREQIRTWLLAYAWANATPEQNAAEVDCILAQDGWQHLSAQAEKYRGMALDDKQASEAVGFALSALYECHDGPHQDSCPASPRQKALAAISETYDELIDMVTSPSFDGDIAEVF